MPKEFFNEEQQKAIVASIKEAELNTSGEIQVHIENYCKKDVLDRAAEVFAALNMHKTKLRNGVLFYLSVKDKKFAILGDAGINAVVPENFWEDIKDYMQAEFRKGNFTEGLCEGIKRAGLQLKKHFPYQPDDVNELPDDISFSNN
ncbi:MAG: TPM domain-containing protein [Cytophagaceae bacterium]|nr:TPM domain-containing protein [Cytophagaceae bacterium]MDW8455149.1 TPM domain-containing protein [Cytophagaceae bacterium]